MFIIKVAQFINSYFFGEEEGVSRSDIITYMSFIVALSIMAYLKIN